MRFGSHLWVGEWGSKELGVTRAHQVPVDDKSCLTFAELEDPDEGEEMSMC